MGDSRDEDRADRRSSQTRLLSRKITTVCCQDSLFSAVELLGKIDLAAIESSSFCLHRRSGHELDFLEERQHILRSEGQGALNVSRSSTASSP